MASLLVCGTQQLDLSQPQVMGVLNATPDSFSDGGQYFRDGKLQLNLALDRAAKMVDEGAGIIDIGGESTRPGARALAVGEELERVIPLVEAIAARLPVVISVDTSTPTVMQQAAVAGAGLINDVRALGRDGAMRVAAQTGLPICLMNMQGQPNTMQEEPK